VSDEIKPRIDGDGVGWCVQGCPFGDKEEATPLSDKTCAGKNSSATTPASREHRVGHGDPREVRDETAARSHR
jgi:hypothetical protein